MFLLLAVVKKKEKSLLELLNIAQVTKQRLLNKLAKHAMAEVQFVMNL